MLQGQAKVHATGPGQGSCYRARPRAIPMASRLRGISNRPTEVAFCGHQAGLERFCARFVGLAGCVALTRRVGCLGVFLGVLLGVLPGFLPGVLLVEWVKPRAVLLFLKPGRAVGLSLSHSLKAGDSSLEMTAVVLRVWISTRFRASSP